MITIFQVNYENIAAKCGSNGKSSCEGNFARAPSGLFPYPEDYDSQSVMHYDGYSFSKSPILKHPTIVNRETNEAVLAQRDRPSVGDIQRICRLYGCSKCGGETQLKCEDGSVYWASRNGLIISLFFCNQKAKYLVCPNIENAMVWQIVLMGPMKMIATFAVVKLRGNVPQIDNVFHVKVRFSHE